MAEKIEVQLLVDTNSSEKNVKNLNKDLKETKTDISGVENAADQATGGMVSGFKNAVKGTKSLVRGLFTVRGAIMATGIGALVLVVASLTSAFTASEDGQNKFAKLMTQIGVVTGNVVNILSDLGNSLMSAGKALFKLATGDLRGAKAAWDDAGDSINAVTDGVKNFVKETKKEISIASDLANMRAKADKAERRLQVDRAKANRDRAELLEKAVNKEKFSVSERIGFLQEAGRIEEKITNQEIAAAKLRLDAKTAENALGLSKKEDLEEEAALTAALINLETAKLTKAKEVTTQIIALNAEEAAAKKAIIDQAKIDQDTDDAAKDVKAKELKDLQTAIKEAEAVSEDERRALEIQKTIDHYDKLIELAIAQGLATEGLVKAKAAAVAKFSKEEAGVQVKWESMSQEEKGKLAKEGFNNMANILGQETAAGKAAAIASATINTFESAQSSYKSLSGIPVIGPALGALAAGAALASGFAQVKAITATKLPSLGGKAAPSVGGGSPSAPAISKPPSFNTVGASETNQLADAIGDQSQQPVKAYVVSGDVTTAQGLDRNIIEGATI